MKVRVRYLGAFTDVAHAKEATYEFSDATLDSLLEHLIEKNGDKFRTLMLDPSTGGIRGGMTLLVNGRRLDPRHPLADNDEVTLLTPLAGG
jgi:molybdopterin converting factor small subunit